MGVSDLSLVSEVGNSLRVVSVSAGLAALLTVLLTVTAAGGRRVGVCACGMKAFGDDVWEGLLLYMPWLMVLVLVLMGEDDEEDAWNVLRGLSWCSPDTGATGKGDVHVAMALAAQSGPSISIPISIGISIDLLCCCAIIEYLYVRLDGRVSRSSSLRTVVLGSSPCVCTCDCCLEQENFTAAASKPFNWLSSSTSSLCSLSIYTCVAYSSLVLSASTHRSSMTLSFS